MTSPTTRPKTPLATNIRRLRRAARLTQSALAARVGVEVLTVSRWERAERVPRQDHLVGLAEVLCRGELSELYAAGEQAAA